MPQGTADGFEEISAQWVGPKKLDDKSRAANEGPQHPGQLTTKEKVAAQPAEQRAPGHATVAGRFKQGEQAAIPDGARAGDQGDMSEQDDAVTNDRRLSSERRCVPEKEKRNRRQRPEEKSGYGETAQDSQRGLTKGEAGAEKLPQHAIEQSIATTGEENEERELHCREKGLERRTPEADRRAISASAQQNNPAAEKEMSWTRLLDERAQPGGSAAEQYSYRSAHG
jgi:hypothetical protein